MRSVALVAVALTSALSLVGCAKDTGAGAGAPSGGGSEASSCKFKPKPPAATAANTTKGNDEKVDGSKLKVGLAYDIGGRGDASFNDSAAAGLDKAKAALGFKESRELNASENEPESLAETRLGQLAQEGFNPIIAVGFKYETALKAVAGKYPNTKFAIVDSVVAAPNVTPLVFAEEQGSFLAGVIAAYKSKNCNVGFIGGVETPLIKKFEAGFVQGAKAAAENIKIATKYISPAGDFSGFRDPDKGRIVAQGQLDGGADVLYHAAGASGKGVFTAAKAGKAFGIGVDSDQYNQKTVEADKDIIISSMLKRVDVAVYDFLKAVAKGDLTTIPKVFDLTVDGVGYATSGGKIDGIKDTVDAFKAQIVSGAIKVADKPGS